MALIKFNDNTKIFGKTIVDVGPTIAEQAQAIVDDYVAAIESADGQSLESAVITAYTDFVAGLLSDEIWSDLKAVCITAGARTLAGALVPLIGSSPTNNNFVSADYDRKGGLKGNKSTKYLKTGRAANDDPQDDFHMSLYVSQAASSANLVYIGTFSGTSSSNYVADQISTSIGFGVRAGSAFAPYTGYGTTGFLGVSRISSSQGTYRIGGNETIVNNTSRTPDSLEIYVHGRNRSAVSGVNIPSDGRISFYSIGEATDFSKLESRVNTLISDLANAI